MIALGPILGGDVAIPHEYKFMVNFITFYRNNVWNLSILV